MAADDVDDATGPAPGVVTVAVGPVEASAARAWLGAARQSMADIRAAADVEVPEPVLAAFDDLLDRWEAVSGGEVFRWEAQMPAAEVRLLSSHWASIAAAVRAVDDHRLHRDLPVEAGPFYDALVVAVATALADAEDRYGDTFARVVPSFDATRPARVERPSRVLIVDDTEDIRLLVRIGLEADPRLEVVGEAGDGAAAIDAARTLDPDAVLLDLRMPRMDGLTALPHLRQAAPGARIVVFSATDMLRGQALAAGADAFLDKSAGPAVIAETLLGPTPT